MTLENASGLPEGQDLPADSTQQTATGAENQEQQVEERKFTQAELEEKLQKRLAKADRRHTAELQSLREEINGLKTAPKPAETQADNEPKRGDYDSYEAFVEARAEWKADQKVSKRLEEFEGKTKKEREESAKAKATSEFNARQDAMVAAGQKAYADFDSVVNEAVEDGILPNRGPLFEALVDSDIGEKLAYHLSKNPAEAERIQKLSVYAQLRELGKLEDKLSAKKEPREAMEPVGGRNSSNPGLRDDSSMEAWMKTRNKQASSR